MFLSVTLAGLATCQIAYLLSEWLLRPVAARALAALPLEDPVLPGVTARTLFSWGLGSGIPLLGLAMVGLSALTQDDYDRDQLAVAILVLTGTALVIGLLTILIAARVTADPIISVRHAVAEVAEGDFDVEVPVYDGSELGLLQSGFNQMVTGCASASGSATSSAATSARTWRGRRSSARRASAARSARWRSCSST